ncbi:unnamed protein product [Cylicocyclus nassatus]|uniref:Uncharacterized protein n=1 Tax=Cylicocyclus nassatus TaxID=53992 RepID=A0AA36GF64_CYLNA|nr:unnamed protein product [Cylicocyclus nassatus]
MLDKFMMMGERSIDVNDKVPLMTQYITTPQLTPNNMPTAGETWRYLARYQWMNNFKRIFAQKGRNTEFGRYEEGLWFSNSEMTENLYDEFIIHKPLCMDYNAHMKAIEDSFERTMKAGVNYFLNKNQFEREQKAWRSNQLFLNDLAQKNQRHAAENVVEGYEMAGLSPALAVNGDFSPAQPRLRHKTELTEEMTRKAAAEADITERESGRMTDEDIQVTKSYRATIERLYNESKDPDIRAIYAAELEALGRFV